MRRYGRMQVLRSSLALCLALAGALGTLAEPLRAQAMFTPDAFSMRHRPAPGLSLYGVPGHILMPSAYALPDGVFALSVNQMGSGLRRGNLVFQISPRVTGVFRYAWFQDYFSTSPSSLYDRSFDLRFRIMDEDPDTWRPALTVGLQDFGGTGVFAAEYLVASRRFSPRLTASAGIGWGRLGSYNSFRNPLSIFSDRFNRRPGFSGLQDTGQVGFDRMFRGPAALFLGMDWQASDQLSFTFEYSSDAMRDEVRNQGFDHRTPLNVGLDYRFRNGGTVGLSIIGGSEVALSYSRIFDPRRTAAPSGYEPGPPRIVGGRPGPASPPGLATALERQGVRLEGMRVDGDVATVAIHNTQWPVLAQAWGRTARVMSAELPPEVTTFRIRVQERGMAIREITLTREELETLEHAPDGAEGFFLHTRMRDPAGDAPRLPWESYTRFQMLPYIEPGIFDPDDPVRMDFGVELIGEWSPMQGLIFSGSVRQRVIGNLDESTRRSNSVLPRVRSNGALYFLESDPYVPWLTAEWFARPGRDLYSRVTFGYLERMFGGISSEILWAPGNRRYAIGAELNHVAQREFSGMGFTNYEVTTGHVSAYYDLGGGYNGQIDAGRYLAGDWGGTATLSRRFGNGIEVGAFFTLTDVSFEDFGEGSFDKGIFFSLPLTNLLGRPTRQTSSFVLRPIQRDGGARLSVPNRLYEVTRPARAAGAGEGWGRVWR